MKRIACICLSLCAGYAAATDIGVVGLFPGKAVLVVDDAPPKAYAVGSVLSSDTKLIAADSETATIIVNGKRQVLTMGQYVHRAAPGSSLSVVLQADTRGHFVAEGQINGSTVNMLVDTGASLIALPASEATRIGINYKGGKLGRTSTANGLVSVYHVKLDSVKIGDVELHQVDASIHEEGLPYALLGMSFLNRMDMRRNGDQMTLTKRY
ncbi:MAG: TIGR02281 family clan AA aspartic protease [Burkholderiales bacterium]|nr:TIGR02281 family clan AA aspartic protease [Burkholderiales bacterium]